MCTVSSRYQIENIEKISCCATRRKLWQLDSQTHCSVIGTCLSLGELRRLRRKIGVCLHATLTDYELHRAFVGIAGNQTHASRQLHKYLDQKYRVTIRCFSRLHEPAALESRWEEAIESGDIAAAYWALVTHPRVTDTLADRVYGEVHMLSHLAGATVRVDMQELRRLQQLTRAMNQQLADTEANAKAQIAEKDDRIQRLNDRLAQTQGMARDLATAREQLAVLEDDALLHRLRKQVEDSAARLAMEQARVERAEASARTWKQMAMENGDRQLQLEGQMAELHAERDALEAMLAKLLMPDCDTCTTQEGCLGDINLCGRCILYVGGRSRQCAHFRSLVERQNGQFIHHDGGLHDGRLRLGAILPQADVVLCPLDCVSHDAANRVKHFCKRHGKKLVLLPRSSLAAFTRGLNELVA
ncbi:MAG: DUF2325 domain-containing protein [Gammaproteobacteria bacterium]|nr:DUF2325 domain-containing protein [Gammaproteobacteria bacterium]